MAFARPQIESRVDEFLAQDPAELDRILGGVAALVLAFRSDDAPALDLDNLVDTGTEFLGPVLGSAFHHG
ncbi:hypothetical protein [Mycolicibacterium sp.]|uniref:hypothetical protein n=1 Tax=Mycolicibacterium sp. TaxID=2320850 RepID=UPI003560B62E